MSFAAERQSWMNLMQFYRSRCGTSFRKPCRRCFAPDGTRSHNNRNNPQTCFEGPFGELLRATGPMAKANPFRFSTKYQDDETDLLYYGYRYYHASTGKWSSRDPVSESGFRMALGRHLARTELTKQPEANDYGAVGNDFLTHYDMLGLTAGACCNEFRPPHSHFRTCEEACAEARLKWLFYIAPGGVMCNGNKPCACLGRAEKIGFEPEICPVIDAILMEHENNHVPFLQCTKCGLYPAETPPGMDWDAEECRQRKKTLEQLRLVEGTLEPECAEVARKLVQLEEEFAYRCP